MKYRSWLLAAAWTIAATAGRADPAYDPGASDTEIRIGNIEPYSGPLSFYGEIGLTLAAYFEMINEQGGINGRRVTFISYDDANNPAKTFEHTRRLVESDGVLMIFQSLGTDTNLAIRKYLNDREIPQLFMATPTDLFADPANYPWTFPYQPSYAFEARIYGEYLRTNFPGAKVGIIHEDSAFGTDLVDGVTAGLAGSAEVIAIPYALEELSIESHLLTLRAAGIEILVDGGTPKFAIQAIRHVADSGWPLREHIVTSVSLTVGAVMEPAGLDNARGIVGTAFIKDPTDPRWHDDPDYREWRAFLERYYPEGNPAGFTAYAYGVGALLVEVLTRCGDDLTRANVLRQAQSLTDVTVPMVYPEISVTTSETDYRPIEALRMVRFDGKSFVPFGPVLGR